MLRESIATYHDLLTDELGAASQAQLDDQLQRRGLFFGDRPLCTVLRPRWMTAEQYRYCRERAGVVLRAFGKAHRAAIADPGVRAQFGLTEWEERLLLHDPGFRDPSPTARLDAFFVGDEDGRGLRFTEYNAETPAGAAYNDVLSEVFYAFPAMRRFFRAYDVRPLPARHNTL